MLNDLALCCSWAFIFKKCGAMSLVMQNNVQCWCNSQRFFFFLTMEISVGQILIIHPIFYGWPCPGSWHRHVQTRESNWGPCSIMLLITNITWEILNICISIKLKNICHQPSLAALLHPWEEEASEGNLGFARDEGPHPVFSVLIPLTSSTIQNIC